MPTSSRFARSVLALSLVALLALSACSPDSAAPVTSAPVSSISSSSTSSVTESSTSSPELVPVTSAAPVVPPTPAGPSVDPLTGDPAVSPNVLVAVKIDNTFPGKQWGVAAADVVYVEMVEGNLSRLIVLFHTTLPAEVGPVRSVRTTDPDVLTAYGTPALMFSGGAGGPLDNFASSGLVDASPGVIGSAYWRSSAASAPYNLHADVAKVSTGVSGVSTPRSPGFTFGGDYPALATQRDITRIGANFANAISFTFTGGVYTYTRRGSAQSDGASGDTFQFQNVLVQHVTAEEDGTIDAVGSPSYKTHTIGSGAFTLYRDGKAVDGTWTRADAGSPTTYADAGGVPVLFKPGKTWVVLAPAQIATSES